jgi:L-asparaginase|uniref:asparaginase n=1 Tax=Eutreptiella gymnastica TaxID=73025 RepID=A0A7S4GK06_9EUGL|mmetsp:Transcript_34815/g.58115  ORF Transcript_34815/g.58115 Transcript_34815/m.58115 type:complete len:364 (-) Transcript_34815:659-1750(-)|eukprot:CAMPEP_0174291786 /NCGR_PEP_ID=MMETSP0809-20121228/33228_1 /TAXON_ID=73025 ORGANISM="Eutreptiella gymnastica-like, Strain CCMP1594" /NCGR_SAMPLE_ID=MMETSP0809 /ASSEMBLY_ACC=CAM_ASM_000658 /LENGTH=363 /DNA_ID=CAMNT_0015391377 /DNA_START=86 /DNA_END=1177 /DNA_ORIENTATION=+
MGPDDFLEVGASRKHLRVLIINTGGVLGMKPTGDGRCESAEGYLAERMAGMTELEREDVPQYEVVDLLPLIDSSEMGPDTWIRIADEIEKGHSQYDGFVVVSGTDTMAYCASALSFMLQNLERPVVLTGSVIGWDMAWNDARRNLAVSMIFATIRDLFEVCIFFGDKLLRGNRACKLSNVDVDAFDSPNFPPLGKLTTANLSKQIKLNWQLLRQPPRGRLSVHRNVRSNILVTRLVPGFSDESLTQLITQSNSLKAMLLEFYGTGNPSAKGDLLDTLKMAIDRGIVVVACTQCRRGHVSLGTYALGAQLVGMGVIPADDMTTEAAVAKLAVVLGRYNTLPEIKAHFARDMAGEKGLISDISKL